MIKPESTHQVSTGPDISLDELQLAVRNHSLPLEALRYPITPIGLHYLLIHFDIPRVEASDWRLAIGGHVRRPLMLTLDEIKRRPAVTRAVTLECAGNGRANLSPRPLSQPWLFEAVGTAEWTGTPLRPLLEEAEALDGAVEVVFTGLDRGVQGGVEQQYERSLSVAEASREEILLAYAINGQPLPPQHGFPLRLVVPGWYGMTHVKWLRSITLVTSKAKPGRAAGTSFVSRSVPMAAGPGRMPSSEATAASSPGNRGATRGRSSRRASMSSAAGRRTRRGTFNR